MATQSNRAPRGKSAQPAEAVSDAAVEPASAAQAEAEGVEMITVEWRGYKFKIPADALDWNFWDVAVPAAYNNKTRVLQGLLGADAVFRLKEAEPNMTQRDANDLLETVEKAIGLHSGKA